MPRCMKDFDGEVAQGQFIAIGDEPIKNRSVAGNIIGFKQVCENRLHVGDVRPDDDRCACLFADVMRGRQMVGMGMGFENESQIKALRVNIIQNGIGRRCGDARVAWREIEHRINDRCGPTGRIMHDIGDGVGGGVEKAVDLRLHENRLLCRG